MARTPDPEAIRALGLGVGFDAVRITDATLAVPVGAKLDAWLAQGCHGSMDWMTRTAARRRHPQALWPEARSVLVCALSYAPKDDPLALLEHADRGVVSVYARNRDYHDVLKGRLKTFAQKLMARFGGDVKVFVDTAPVLEKPLAAKAGIGWQGKHTNLVSRQHGSWLFLGELFTTLELPPESPEADHCGSCARCLDICPTAAFPAPYQLDARRCISYLTIEHKGPIPRALRPLMGNRIYGCDDCLAVCPWNKFATPANEAAFLSRAELTAPRLADLAALDDATFRRVFAGSPIKRIGRDRFVRNVLIALGNSGQSSLARHVLPLLDDPAPVVRGAAVWALGRLDLAALSTAQPVAEADPTVREEWEAALCAA